MPAAEPRIGSYRNTGAPVMPIFLMLAWPNQISLIEIN